MPSRCLGASPCHSPFFDLLLEEASDADALPNCATFSNWTCMNQFAMLVLDRTRDRRGGKELRCVEQRKQERGGVRGGQVFVLLLPNQYR